MVKLGLGASLGIGGLAVLGVLAFIFRDKISDFFSTITGGAEAASKAGDITNAALDNLLGNVTGTQKAIDSLTEAFNNLFNQNNVPPESFTPPVPNDEQIVPQEDIARLCQCGGVIQTQHGITFAVCNDCQTQPEVFDQPPAPILDPNRPLNLAQVVNQFTQPIQTENFNVQTDVEGNQFGGGGVSFVGGTVRQSDPFVKGFENPLSFLTRSGDLTASQAANQLAIARGFTPQEQAFLNQGQEISPLGDFASTPQTSGGFQGLTPQEIALRLTGGIISNF